MRRLLAHSGAYVRPPISPPGFRVLPAHICRCRGCPPAYRSVACSLYLACLLGSGRRRSCGALGGAIFRLIDF
jgi:hypothetical protein